MINGLPFSEPTSVTADERAELLKFALRCAASAAKEALPFFRTTLDVTNKRVDEGFDPVTAADRAVEQAIRVQLADTYPQHGVFGEEFGSQPGDGLTWVIDPIDGTRAYMSGLLHWGVLLGLFDGQRAVLGVMVQPVTGEVFWGDGDSAWYRQGEQAPVALTVRPERVLAESIAATSWVGYFQQPQRAHGFDALADRVQLLHLQGDCYLYGLLAMGQLDLVIDGGLSPYDILPLIPIIEGAGGVILSGDGAAPENGGFVVAGSSRALVLEAIAVLNQA